MIPIIAGMVVITILFVIFNNMNRYNGSGPISAGLDLVMLILNIALAMIFGMATTIILLLLGL